MAIFRSCVPLGQINRQRRIATSRDIPYRPISMDLAAQSGRAAFWRDVPRPDVLKLCALLGVFCSFPDDLTPRTHTSRLFGRHSGGLPTRLIV